MIKKEDHLKKGSLHSDSAIESFNKIIYGEKYFLVLRMFKVQRLT